MSRNFIRPGELATGDVVEVESARTGMTWWRTRKMWGSQSLWINDEDSEVTWYHLNVINPLSEGYYVLTRRA